MALAGVGLQRWPCRLAALAESGQLCCVGFKQWKVPYHLLTIQGLLPDLINRVHCTPGNPTKGTQCNGVRQAEKPTTGNMQASNFKLNTSAGVQLK